MKMKKILISLSVLSFLGSTTALSTPVANLRISGDIKPPTCVVNGMGNDGDLEFKYGLLSPGLIPATAVYVLPRQDSTLNVVCDAATYLTFSMSDVYPISDYVNQYSATRHLGVYGLVSPSTGKEIGGISFSIENLQVDGKPAYLSQTSGGSNWRVEALAKNRVAGWTKTNQPLVDSASQLDLMPGKSFSANIYTYALEGYSFIKSAQDLAAEGIDISEGFDFVGQAVMTFNFGI